jgi:hypothetical protein
MTRDSRCRDIERRGKENGNEISSIVKMFTWMYCGTFK